MYISPFYITNSVWNNTFSFDKRENKKLYVPSLIKANSFLDIQLWEEIVFEDFDFDDKLQSCKWLRNFYEFDITTNLEQIQGRFLPSHEWQKNKKLYLFDNHNHAYFFWYLAKRRGYIKNNSTLYHIDEHADTRDPWIYLKKEELSDLQKIFDYTNFTLNVGNYILPAVYDWLISEVVQVRSETELVIVKEKLKRKNEWNWKDIILNLDLDFFEPELDYIDYNLKKEVILELTKKASVITVATSPFFIDQKLALEVFRDILFS